MKINHRKLNQIATYFCDNDYKLALAESMSAGFFSSIWSLQCDSGQYLQGGIVCFSKHVKENLLEVPESIIQEFSAESIEVTEAMLHGLKKRIQADLYIAITGVAYQGVEAQVSAPGDVYLVIDFQGKTHRRKVEVKTGNAADVYIRAFNQSLLFLDDVLASP